MAGARPDRPGARPRPRPVPYEQPTVVEQDEPAQRLCPDARSDGGAARGVVSANGSRPGFSAAADGAEPGGTTAPRARDARGRYARRSATGSALARQQEQSQQVAVAAGSAVVTAARVGRLLGRTGWRLAKQLPGVGAVEARVQQVGTTLVSEFARLLDSPSGVFAGGTTEEQRAMTLLQNAAHDPEPLRSAMSELLERSAQQGRGDGNDYLFGTIISQLVPDEARILAALVGGREYAVVDVVVKPVRGSNRVELANASTVGRAAKVATPGNTGTYLTRLHGFGLIDFGPPGDELASQFDALGEDPAVQRARVDAEGGKARVVRKRVTMSPFGAQFWAACSPLPPVPARRG